MEYKSKRFSGPTPEVIYLPTIFRRIHQGEIRIPAFQRGFVWTEDKVISLLESIYQGFPVGSILLWKVEDKILKVETPKFSMLPAVPEKYPTSFVLDGLQRLSSLYAVFHYKSRIHKKFMDVSFDWPSSDDV